MSDTRRKTDYGWEYGTPEFDEWNEDSHCHCGKRKIMSRKDQTKDRSPMGKMGGKHGRFQNHSKNCKYNLEQKNYNDQWNPDEMEY